MREILPVIESSFSYSGSGGGSGTGRPSPLGDGCAWSGLPPKPRTRSAIWPRYRANTGFQRSPAGNRTVNMTEHGQEPELRTEQCWPRGYRYRELKAADDPTRLPRDLVDADSVRLSSDHSGRQLDREQAGNVLVETTGNGQE